MESAIPKGGEDSKGIMMSYGGGPGIEALRKVRPDVVKKWVLKEVVELDMQWVPAQ